MHITSTRCAIFTCPR